MPKMPYSYILKDVERDLGLPENMFAVMKCQARDKYKYVMAMQPDHRTAWLNYQAKVETLLDNLTDMYWEIYDEDTKDDDLHKLGRYLVRIGLWAKYTFYRDVELAIFKLEKKMPHSSYLKYKEAYKIYKEGKWNE